MGRDEARVHTWASIDVDRPMDKIDRQRIIGEMMMISRVMLHKGFVVGEHHHPNEQLVVVLSGRCRFMVGRAGGAADKEVMLGAGQVLELPPNVPHACEAIEDTLILDLFSPVSEKTGVDRAPG